jgi:SAM-dependent methyltransferase
MQAVCFLTHVDNAAVRAEIAKLQDACDLLGFSLAVIVDTAVCQALPNCWSYTHESLKAQGYRLLDVAGFPVAMLHGGVCDVPLLAWCNSQNREFDFVWLIEYDIRYSGNWAEFLSLDFGGADFVTSTLLREQDCKFQWVWWESLVTPDGVDRWNTYCPVFRLSGRAICLMQELRTSPVWGGHAEAFLPTAILNAGFFVGSYCDYTTPDSFRLWPPVIPDPDRPGLLWHPFKSHLPEQDLLYRQAAQVRAIEEFAATGSGMYGAAWGDPETTPHLIPVRERLAAVLSLYHDPSVLEIGSGGGRWTEHIQRLTECGCLSILEGTQVAIDLTKTHLARCGLRPPGLCGVSSDGHFANLGMFDVVFSFDVFVHFNDELIVNYLELIASRLKPGGHALISVACEYTGEGWERSHDWFNYIATSYGRDYSIREPFNTILTMYFCRNQNPVLIGHGYGQLLLELQRK